MQREQTEQEKRHTVILQNLIAIADVLSQLRFVLSRLKNPHGILFSEGKGFEWSYALITSLTPLLKQMVPDIVEVEKVPIFASLYKSMLFETDRLRGVLQEHFGVDDGTIQKAGDLQPEHGPSASADC